MGRSVWGDWRSTSFQILGFDVLLDEGGVPHLLEVNAKPSLAIDTCYSIGHSSFEVPPEPSSELEEAAILKHEEGRYQRVPLQGASEASCASS